MVIGGTIFKENVDLRCYRGAELAKLTGNEDDRNIASEIDTQINKEVKISARKNKKQYGEYLASCRRERGFHASLQNLQGTPWRFY